eukprot:Nitzschia sp. Nitz4//scaffold20_size174350//19231//21539//NITZ4_002080-RA/size174350-processed-gene-0.260-mRNA-1//1//CDS//3329541743//7924//frame0
MYRPSLLQPWRHSIAAYERHHVTPIRAFSSEVEAKKRVSLALYRQLLRWCNENDEDLPLSHFVPPVYMAPPQVDADKLKEYAASEELKAHFPPKSIITDANITCPIHTTKAAKDFFRVVFRLNGGTQDINPDHQKEQVTLAFEAIRSLNELSTALVTLKRNRASHSIQDHVQFQVGQVVRHNVEQWRGIITGWRRIDLASEPEPAHEPSSLTQKQYLIDPLATIRYSILIDAGDSHLFQPIRQETATYLTDVHQAFLDPVEDERLLRVRHSRVSQFFTKFDPIAKRFIPNHVVAYEYPHDAASDEDPQPEPTVREEQSRIRAQVMEGIQEASEHLRRIILNYTSAPEARDLKILALFLSRLTNITKGDVLTVKDKLAAEPVMISKLVSMYVKEFTAIAEEIGDLIWRRRQSLATDRTIQYSLGDVVRHTKFGYRGVIVGWHAAPTVDVSNWDGLQDIENPEQYPFYAVVADQSDCIAAFGGERPTRYVCEANLEMCPADAMQVEVDLDPAWKYGPDGFTPPEDFVYKYGEDIGDDGLTHQCLLELRDALATLFVAVRDNTPSGNDELDSIASKMSMSNLMGSLKYAEDQDSATNFSDGMKEVIRAHLDEDLRYELDSAIEELLAGNFDEALDRLTDILEKDPTYAEAHLRVATCYLFFRDYEQSTVYAKKALDIQPNHFQAQNGLGLAYYELNDINSAVEAFQKSMELDPWSPVSSKLSACLDAQKLHQETTEEVTQKSE